MQISLRLLNRYIICKNIKKLLKIFKLFIISVIFRIINNTKMKVKEVLKSLNITKVTLHNFVKIKF